MQNSKFEAYIGFSIKSGSIIYGSDKIFEFKKKLQLVIIDESTNVKIVNKLLNLSEVKGFTLVKSKILLSELTKRDNVKVVSVLDKNFVSAILKNCTEDILILKEGENKLGK